MNELRIEPSIVLRNSARGMRSAWTFTPPASSARSAAATFLSSIVTSTRSMSDFAQTVSCDRLPQRIAARMERSCLTCSTSASSASVNFSRINSFSNRRGQSAATTHVSAWFGRGPRALQPRT